MNAKEANLVVVNDVSRSDVGFDAPDNEVLLVAPGEPARRVPRASKREIADRIWDEVLRIRTSARARVVSTPES
jgi:phosphopantothenoylcysteine decarboxylase / phosphopantothenate---cysteine ligase